MSLKDKLSFGRNRDEEATHLDETTPDGDALSYDQTEQAAVGYNDSLARLGIESETVIPDDLLTSGQAKKVRFDSPLNPKNGYSAQQVDEFIRDLVIPTLDAHERSLHSRDTDVFRLGKELDDREVELNKKKFDATVQDSLLRVEGDREFETLMAQLDVAERQAAELQAEKDALFQENTDIRNQYEKLYAEYLPLWEAEAARVAAGEQTDEVVATSANAVELEGLDEEELLLAEQAREGEIQERINAAVANSEALVREARAEAAVLQARIEELEDAVPEVAENSEVEEQISSLAAQARQAEDRLLDAQRAIEDAERATAEAAGRYTELYDQHEELIRRIEAGEYDVPAEADLAAQAEYERLASAAQAETVRISEELSLKNAELEELRARLNQQEYALGQVEEEEAFEEEQPVYQTKPQAAPKYKEADLPPGIRPDDL